jgi:predicted GNAT family N-acyltransferase
MIECYRYDPISAHFILIGKEDGKAVGTVRLTPYPRPHTGSSGPHHDPQPGAKGAKIAQNDTAMVTSGGGPGGTSGGLAMKVSSDSNASPFHNEAPPKSDKAYHTGISRSDEPSGLVSNTDKEEKLKNVDPGYPLGGPQTESSVAHEFLRKLKSKEPFKEAEGAPHARGAKLSRMAVSKTLRGKGIGALIVQQAESWLLKILAEGGGTHQGAMGSGGENSHEGEQGSVQNLTIIVSSQMQAKGFYEKLSYNVYGEPYDEEGMDHVWCIKQLVYEAQ